jgi:HD superfamily phosphohydrolase
MRILFKNAVFLSLTLTALFIKTYEMKTSCGIANIDHPCLQELIDSALIQRLKYVDQSGPLAYYGYCPFFSRYEHSVGVLALIQKANRNLAEEVAGLLHDASHTAFSHVADILFKIKDQNHSYQDSIHLKFLETLHVSDIIDTYDLTLEGINPDAGSFFALEQPLPALCADRIQYTIHTGLLFNKISPQEAEQIITDLTFVNNEWVFTDIKSAQKFAHLSVLFTKEFWGSPLNSAINDCFVTMLKNALQEKTISYHDIQYSTDQHVLEKINKSKNRKIIQCIEYLSHIEDHFEIVTEQSNPFCNYLTINSKFRGTDPFVRVSTDSIVHLSDLDDSFKKEFLETQEWCHNGYILRIDW